MELKIIADKKLLDALDRLVEAIRAVQTPAAASVAAQTLAVTEEPTLEAKPTQAAPAVAESTSEVTADVPSRESVQHVAVTKIRGGKRDKVKALIAKYGADRVSGVAEEKLAAFKAELEAL